MQVLCAWQRRASRQAFHQRLVAACDSVRRRRKLARALVAWHCFAANRADATTVERLLRSRAAHKCAEQALAAWVAAAHEHVTREQAKSHLGSRLAASVLRRWVLAVAAQRRIRATAASSAANCLRRERFLVFVAWQHAAAQQQSSRHLGGLAESASSRRCLQRALPAWSQAAIARSCTTRSALAHADRQRARLARQSVATLTYSVRQRAVRSQQLQRAAQHARRHQQHEVWQHWVHLVRSNRKKGLQSQVLKGRHRIRCACFKHRFVL